MVNLLGASFDSRIKVKFALSRIYGIGIQMASVVLNDLNLGYDLRIKDLTQQILANISRWFVKNKIFFGITLKQKIYEFIENLKNIKVYRGIRHIKYLPVRGQRTRSNSSTIKKIN